MNPYSFRLYLEQIYKTTPTPTVNLGSIFGGAFGNLMGNSKSKEANKGDVQLSLLDSKNKE